VSNICHICGVINAIPIIKNRITAKAQKKAIGAKESKELDRVGVKFG
jgi:hypothetical protein